MAHHHDTKQVSFNEATRAWAKIGLLSFGGPTAQIALMHRIVVEQKKWLSEAQFLNALSFCMLLPGPEAMQLGTYVGWRLHGWRGGNDSRSVVRHTWSSCGFSARHDLRIFWQYLLG